MTYNRMEAKPIDGEHCRFCGDAKVRWSKRRVVSSGFVAIRPFCRFKVADDVKWSMSVLACAIPTMRIGMVGLGRVVRNAVISGRREIIKPMRRIPSIGPDIEAWAPCHEAQIGGTENRLYKALLDTLVSHSINKPRKEGIF